MLTAPMTEFETVSEAAQRYGVTPQAIHHHLKRGRFPGARKVLGMWRLPVIEVEALDRPIVCQSGPGNTEEVGCDGK